jgi:mRNA interferase RelE/StbE
VAYKIAILPSALRHLANLPRPDQKRVASKIDHLSTDPRPPGAKKLKSDHDLYRIRIGKYRVIYAVEDVRLTVLVVRVGHRREVYRGV